MILAHEDIVHELEHLPGVDLFGNHTISMRALEGTTSSPLVSINIQLHDGTIVQDPVEVSPQYILWGSVFAIIVLVVIFSVMLLKNNDGEVRHNVHDSDIDEIVAAEIIE